MIKFNFIRKCFRLVKKDKKKFKLSPQQIDELINLNKEILTNIGDDVDYDGMGNYGRFPPEKK